MHAAFYRIQDSIFVGIVLSVFFSMAVAYLPNYQRKVYRNTEPVKYDKYESENVGYPAGMGYPSVKSVEDIMANRKYQFVLEINVEDLRPLDYYRGISTSTYCKTAMNRAMVNNIEGGVGRFFVATLQSQEKVLVFIDDTTIDEVL